MDCVGFEPTISAAVAFSKDVNLQPVVAQRHDSHKRSRLTKRKVSIY
jgi:hypothetical protein